MGMGILRHFFCNMYQSLQAPYFGHSTKRSIFYTEHIILILYIYKERKKLKKEKKSTKFPSNHQSLHTVQQEKHIEKD